MKNLFAWALACKEEYSRKLGGRLLPDHYGPAFREQSSTPPGPEAGESPDAAYWRNVDMADVLQGYKPRLRLTTHKGRWWIDVVAVPLNVPSWTSTRWARKGVTSADPELCTRKAVYAMMHLDGADLVAIQRMRNHLRNGLVDRMRWDSDFPHLAVQAVAWDDLDPPGWITPEARKAWRSNRGLIPYWYHSSNPHYRHRRPPAESACITADPAVDWYSGGWVGPHKPAGFRE
ncbi:hypothetical protein [Stenotrophomonas phage BUCT603]|nr:hypothetical protein [Stenotrophomonas phage BUCT603]